MLLYDLWQQKLALKLLFAEVFLGGLQLFKLRLISWSEGKIPLAIFVTGKYYFTTGSGGGKGDDEPEPPDLSHRSFFKTKSIFANYREKN